MGMRRAPSLRPGGWYPPHRVASYGRRARASSRRSARRFIEPPFPPSALATRPHLCHAPRRSTAGADLDSFSYFIAFYSLILGLALTELLGGFAHMVRAK